MDIKKYAKNVYNHNEKSGIDNVHKDFLKEYRKLVKENVSNLKGDCPLGNYCGHEGCVRWYFCDFKDDYPKSKELAIKLGRYKESKA